MSLSLHPSVLAIDASTHHALVALARGGEELLVAGSDVARRHASALVPEIAGLLDRAGVGLEAIDALVVGLGPGSFTGLRVGLTLAKTLAYVTRKPLVGLGSLDLIACNLRDPARRAVVVADAQRGEWHVARFRPTPAGTAPTPEGPLTIEPADTVIGSLAPDQVLLGPALERLRARDDWPLRHRALEPACDYPRAEGIVRLGLIALERGLTCDPMTLEPIYVRRSAAEEKADALHSRPATPGVAG